MASHRAPGPGRQDHDDDRGRTHAWLRCERTARPSREVRTAGSGVGARLGELDGRRLDGLDRPEDDGAVLGVDDDRLADPELLPEDLLGERVLDELLDRPPQRPRPEGRLVAPPGDELLGRTASARARCPGCRAGRPAGGPSGRRSRRPPPS